MDPIADQIALEQEIDAVAEARAIKEFAEHLRSGNVDKLPKAKLLIGNMFPHVHASILAEQSKVIRGVGAKVRGWLREIPTEVAAVIAMRATLRIVLGGNIRVKDSQFGATFQRIAVGIGREWVQEVQIRQAEKVNPAYYQAAMQGLERANVSSQKHIHSTISRVIRNTLEGLYDCPLTDSELAQLGKFGLQGCVDAGLVELDRSTGRVGHIVTYHLPQAVAAFLEDSRAAVQMAAGTNTPMTAPPLPWEALVGGGYYTERRQVRYPLLNYRKNVRRSHVKAYHAACSQAEMPKVYDYVNYVQSIPYRLNPDVFQHVLRVWQAGGGAMGMPTVQGPVKPPFPFAEDWKKAEASEAELEVFARWKRATTRWHEANRKHQSVVWEMASFVQNATKYASSDVYFPCFLDGRGRLYYRSVPNPQGSDAAKAVIQFARKKPLGPRGVYWLQVHIANCFGVDKARFDDRAAWTREHWDRLQKGLERPEESGVFEEADSPLCALAACLELNAALLSGNPAAYCTGLPVHMDATCSGLQHFAAMLRDEVGGQYVNLTPGGDQKADIYRRVAELAVLQIQRDAEGGNPVANEWRQLGVDRSLAKSPVMTYVYGATLMSVHEGVEGWLEEHGWSHADIRPRQMAHYMAKLLFRAIEDTVPAAAAAMRWLRECMKKVQKSAPVQWVTPLGMTVNHDYREEERTRVRVRSCGVEYVVMYQKLDSCKTVRMQNAIAPNFVHSLDGTHLGMTALRMQDSGLDMVCIHDSFGTHPSDVDKMHEHIRAAFIGLYKRDVLSDFAEQLGIEVTYPSTGALDLEGVRASEFFFC